MAKIGLIDVDGHNFPNLALMKISAYHKSIGDTVQWYNIFNDFDIVYKAKVFSFTNDYYEFINNSKEIIIGGTGYNKYNNYEHDNIQPDYQLYQNASWYDNKTAYGFITRGCTRNCEWCIVPKKEGKIKPYMDIEEIAKDKKKVILMDNNILASDFGLQQIEKIIKLGLKVDFNQGLDARIIAENNNIAILLSKVKWLNYLRMSCDSEGMKEYVKKAIYLLRKYNCKPKQYFIYVLLKELNNSYERINFCKGLNLKAFAQPYRDFTRNQIIPQWQLDMARYTNHKAIYFSIDFKKYQPRKNFCCKEYFKVTKTR